MRACRRGTVGSREGVERWTRRAGAGLPRAVGWVRSRASGPGTRPWPGRLRRRTRTPGAAAGCVVPGWRHRSSGSPGRPCGDAPCPSCGVRWVRRLTARGGSVRPLCVTTWPSCVARAVVSVPSRRRGRGTWTDQERLLRDSRGESSRRRALKRSLRARSAIFKSALRSGSSTVKPAIRRGGNHRSRQRLRDRHLALRLLVVLPHPGASGHQDVQHADREHHPGPRHFSHHLHLRGRPLEHRRPRFLPVGVAPAEPQRDDGDRWLVELLDARRGSRGTWTGTSNPPSEPRRLTSATLPTGRWCTAVDPSKGRPLGSPAPHKRIQ